jgi:2-iminoacetate synthase
MQTDNKETAKWIKNRIKQEEIDKYLKDGEDFINDELIESKIKSNIKPDKKIVEDILNKSLAINTLSLDETAYLLNVDDPDLLALMQETALKVKKKVYDNRIVTFAPLYISNVCVNNCQYCGFRCSNQEADRRILTQDEVKRETEVLAGEIGHKRLIVVYGEHPTTDYEYIAETLKTIYSVKVPTKNGYGQIRRANVNAAPMPIEALKYLHKIGIGTYQVFQETYHHKTYEVVHPKNTIKGNYKWRLYCMHRAMEAGVDDVGLGVLFGLADWKFEVMALVAHAHELESVFGIGPHTISFPRLEPAENTPFTKNSKYMVNDKDFLKLITVIRLAVPYTGMIITARESHDMRTKSLKLGITQTDASTKIGIGAYSDHAENQQGNKQQFYLGDTRSLDEVIGEFARLGFITSFCTAGYRCGRTGKCIMDLLRTGAEGKYCKLNAVLTFREWLDDFASPQTKAAGEKVIAAEIEEVKDKMPKVYNQFMEYYKRIKDGERDLYF